MYLMRSRRKSIKPPVQDKTAGDDDKSKLTKPDQKPKDQTNGMKGLIRVTGKPGTTRIS